MSKLYAAIQGERPAGVLGRLVTRDAQRESTARVCCELGELSVTLLRRTDGTYKAWVDCKDERTWTKRTIFEGDFANLLAGKATV